MPLFFSNFFRHQTEKKASIEVHRRSPIHLEQLLTGQTEAFIDQLREGPRISSEEAKNLFHLACQSSTPNVKAIFALAEHYPEVVNPHSLTEQLKLSGANSINALLANGLALDKTNAPASLAPLFSGAPQPGLIRFIDTKEEFIEVTNKSDDLCIVLVNKEGYDCAVAAFDVAPSETENCTPDLNLRTKPKIIPRDVNSKAMLPSLYGTQRKLEFPNYTHFSPVSNNL